MIHPNGDLTRRQLDVLVLVARGLANKEIAGTLHLTEPAVKKHVSILLRKLGAPNRTALVRHAFEHHILEAGSARTVPS